MTQCLLCYMIFQLVNYRSNSFQRRLRKPVIEWIKLRWRKLRIFNCHAIFFLLHFFKNVCWGRALEISPLWCHLGSWCLSKVSDNCIFLMVFFMRQAVRPQTLHVFTFAHGDLICQYFRRFIDLRLRVVCLGACYSLDCSQRFLLCWCTRRVLLIKKQSLCIANTNFETVWLSDLFLDSDCVEGENISPVQRRVLTTSSQIQV